MKLHSPLLAVATLIGLLPGSAFAQGLSTDVELVRPTFSTGSLAWADSPLVTEGTLRAGLLYQFEQNPLIYYLYENYEGPIIGTRQNATLGVTYDFTDQISARLVLPTALNANGEVPVLNADQIGVGDPNVGARFEIVTVGPLTIGTRADVWLPIGTKQAYLGEDGFRAGAGLLLRAQAGNRVALLMDTNVVGRPSVQTAQDFVLGSEIALNPGVLVALWPDLVEINAGVTQRGGFQNLADGGAENSLEALAGVRFWPEEFLQVDVGYGKGISDGYGTTFNRVTAMLTYVRQPPPPPEVNIVVEVEPPPQVVITELEPETEEPEWEEGQLAKIDAERIVIKDPIQFEVDTSNILDESMPTLNFVAKLLALNGQIVHLVIEGHASEEGSYEYNYELSGRRSQAIWEQLLTNGVAPSRISHRAMGEVAPVEEGSDEETLAKSRRVVFQITKQIDVLEEMPEYALETRIPWTGEPITLQRPSQQMPDEMMKDLLGTQQERDYIDPSQFLDDDEDEFEMEGDSEDDSAPAPEESERERGGGDAPPAEAPAEDAGSDEAPAEEPAEAPAEEPEEKPEEKPAEEPADEAPAEGTDDAGEAPEEKPADEGAERTRDGEPDTTNPESGD